MYDIISAFQCYTISVDVYFPLHCTLWMACFTFLLILCYCCCAHDNDVSHTLHWEWGATRMVGEVADKPAARRQGPCAYLLQDEEVAARPLPSPRLRITSVLPIPALSTGAEI